ncbi:hypothetical protein [Hymenobacter terrestris]|uniref:Glycosyltransferase RgtA/B/C/D-like domain-containing protein n=1 Tax=Hymenobacter terrestris TaxID=2748310 RepID=A0ABX2Q3S1_9BACT|nr:hypothetical protein [Hymenobacter terrestris]NVO85579.1 hypothetical protein [Hymenobacter terrestris]
MLLSKRYATRLPLYLAIATMLALLVLAWHLYVERTAYYDLAYHLFYYLKTEGVFVQNRRFVAIVTQLPTLLAIKAGLPLDAVMRVYSVAFVGYYLAVLLACAYWFRNEQVALVVALCFVLLTSRTFYWAQSELPQGLVALLLYYAGISRQAPLQRRFSTLALATLVPVAIFAHPLLLLGFLFLWAYDWLLNQRFRDPLYYGLLLLGLLSYGLRALLVPPGSYETTQNTFGPNLKRYFPDYFSLSSFDTFWELSRTEFVALPVLLVLLTVFYLRRGTRLALLRLLLMWGFVGGYVFIISVTRPDYTELAYLGNFYLPLTLFVAVPLALELLPALELRWPRWAPATIAVVLAVVLVARLNLIWQRHPPYTAYQQWITHVLAYTKQFPERKFLLYPNNIDPHQIRAGWPWWALASETLIRSAQQSPDAVQTIQVGWDIDALAQQGSQPGMLLGPFEALPAAEMSARYVRFPTNTIYRRLNSSPPQDAAGLTAYIEANRGVTLSLPDATPTGWAADQQHTIRVRVAVPAANQPLHSATWIEHPTMLRTAFYRNGDWPADAAPVPTPLELDVWHPWTQTLALQTPTRPGRYTFEISLISQNYRDWPVKLRFPVEVTD